MERIKDAIERARVAREQGKTSDESKSESNSVAVARSVRGVPADPATIEYHKTSVQDLDVGHLEKNRIISLSKTDPRTIAFDRLRTQVTKIMQDNGWRTIAVTSPTTGCGKTTVSINLAFSIAYQTEQTVLLVDFDLRAPDIANYLGIGKKVSLYEYVRGECDLSDVFVNPGIPRLTVLPNQTPILNAAETLMTTRVRELVTDIRNRYESRMVIFDLPPLLSTDDALAFLPQVDCVLLVVSNGVTTKSEIRESMRLVSSSELIGTVLNMADDG